MTNRDILGLLNSLLDDLPKAEKRIAKKILESPEKIIHMTASELGKYAEASAATVIRLTQRLKIGSFTELKVSISRFISTEERTTYSDIQKGESIDEIMDTLYWNSALALKDTIAIINKEAIIEAAELIQKASVIFTYGGGASSLGAENISQKWSRIGKTCIHIQDSRSLTAALQGSKDNTILIGVSNTGETQELINLSNIAHDNGHKIISITRFGNDSLSKKAHISLQHVRTSETEAGSIARSALYAQFLVIDILYYVYMSLNHQPETEEAPTAKTL